MRVLNLADISLRQWIQVPLAFCFFVSFTCKHSFSQETAYPQSYFRSPMGIPLFLSGNFGELRKNHFHTGLDIKTQGVEGLPVYATADGYISRIKKSPWGYGNVLYIDHPGGYTTVYGHLQKFNSAIEDFYKKIQSKKETYALDLYPGSQTLKVNKGDVIGLSGNSGSSGGPHLHFEIRNTETENPINPMLFGFKIKDNIPPRIQGIRLYAFPQDSMVGVCNESHTVTMRNGRYELQQRQQITVNSKGVYGLAVHSTDMLNGSGNICGIYIARLFVDGNLIFEQEIDTLDFYTNRYMNAHTDYRVFMDSKKSYHKSFIEPNNKLSIYNRHIKRGLFEINDNQAHQVKYEIVDVSGNRSVLQFSIKNTGQNYLKAESKEPVIKCCSNTEYHFDGVNYYFPSGTVYHHTPLNYEHKGKEKFSDKHQINNEDTPVHQYFYVQIATTAPARLHEKCIVVQEENGRIYARGGRVIDDFIQARVRSFGSYYVTVDTTAPVISFTNISHNKTVSGKSLWIEAHDNLSGVAEYKAFINGNWAPARYDAKRRRYVIDLRDVQLPRGKHILRFECSDERENKSVNQIQFVY